MRQAEVTRSLIFLVRQRQGEIDDPAEADLCAIGTLAIIRKALKHSSGNYSVIVTGLARARLLHLTQRSPFIAASVELIRDETEKQFLCPTAARRLVDKLSAHGIAENKTSQLRGHSPGECADMLAPLVGASTPAAQALLEMFDPNERLARVLEQLEQRPAEKTRDGSLMVTFFGGHTTR